MDNNSQLQDLLAKSESIAKRFNQEHATNAAVAELAQIVADLIDIVHAHVFRDNDPGQP